MPRSAEVRPVSEDTPQLATASLHARSALCSCAKVAHVQPRAPVATGAPILEQSASSNPAHHSPTDLDTRMLAMRVRAHGPPEALLMELVDVPRPGPHQLLVCPSAIRTPHAHAPPAVSAHSGRGPSWRIPQRAHARTAAARRATSARSRSALQAWAYAAICSAWLHRGGMSASRHLRLGGGVSAPRFGASVRGRWPLGIRRARGGGAGACDGERREPCRRIHPKWQLLPPAAAAVHPRRVVRAALSCCCSVAAV